MRSVGTLTTATLLAATVFGGLGTASTAQATTKEEVAINGTFRATSIGDWAKINDQYYGEPTVVQTWTISSSCATFQECHGTVTSDQGWSAPLYMNLTGDVEGQTRCAELGAVRRRHRVHRTADLLFLSSEPDNGEYQLGSPIMAGKDKTVGPSGACGQNQWLDIAMPLRLDKLPDRAFVAHAARHLSRVRACIAQRRL